MRPTSTDITYLIIGLLFLIAVFVIIREFVLWYYRINERTELLKEIRDLLKEKLNGDDMEQNDG